MLTMTLDDLILAPIFAVLRLVRPFRKESIVVPHERIERDYEWQAEHLCPSCKLTGRALFIEWLPERVTTAECPFCGFETEVAREGM